MELFNPEIGTIAGRLERDEAELIGRWLALAAVVVRLFFEGRVVFPKIYRRS